MNRYQGILWFKKESFDQLLMWMFRVAVITLSRDAVEPADSIVTDIVASYNRVRELQRAEAESKYQVEKLLEAVKK